MNSSTQQTPHSAPGLDFHGYRVLVTGAAGGIGGAMARGFSDCGADLVLADRDEAGLRSLEADLDGARSIVYDQSNPAEVQALADQAGPVDVLMNNAGILHTGAVLEMEPAIIQDLIDTNLLGPILLGRAVGSGMVERKHGVIVNTSSQLAFCGAATRAVYAATKAAIRHFTMSFAAELAPYSVRVVAIAPGRTMTPMNASVLESPGAYTEGLKHIPHGRYGEAGEIARLAMFLASPLADYVVGETLVADGGFVTV